MRQLLPALTRMVEIATEVLQEPRPLSPQMMRWEQDHWVDYCPAELADRLGQLQLSDIANSSAVQKQLMDEMYVRNIVDIFEFDARQALRQPVLPDRRAAHAAGRVCLLNWPHPWRLKPDPQAWQGELI